MPFKNVFVAVALGTALVVAAFLVNAQRPRVERDQPSAALVEASGKCAECHRRETSGDRRRVRAEHARRRRASTASIAIGRVEGRTRRWTTAASRSPRRSRRRTARSATRREYDQFTRSRHAAAVVGGGERREGLHAGAARARRALPPGLGEPRAERDRRDSRAPPRSRAAATPATPSASPNADGSFGTCTNCHARHSASVALARATRRPAASATWARTTRRSRSTTSRSTARSSPRSERAMNLHADPKHLTTADMSVPTCATCHMSGLEGVGMTHDTTERLSWYLFAPVSTKRPGYERGQAAMKDVCTKCHARPRIDDVLSDGRASARRDE